MYLIAFVTFIAITSAAQLPSTAYLPQKQGGFQQGGFSQSQSFQSSSFQSSQSSSHIGGGGDTSNRRPQQEQEKNAQIIKQDQEITDNGFHYNYETSNGIKAEESGNAAQTQGGFSYKGDDGHTYTVVFTAGEGGFNPQGDHLPVPPPIPQEILAALQQNEKDEASGIFDDGQYRPDAHGGGKPGQSGGGFGSSSSSSHIFGSSSHQSSFNANSGYKY